MVFVFREVRYLGRCSCFLLFFEFGRRSGKVMEFKNEVCFRLVFWFREFSLVFFLGFGKDIGMRG